MGLFRRKESKADMLTAEARAAVVSIVTNDRIADYSSKSPRLVTTTKSAAAMVGCIPDIPIPKAPDPNTNPAGYLRSIHAVRERSRLILIRARSNDLNHFDVDISKFQDTANYVVSIIKVGFNKPGAFSIDIVQRDFSDDYSAIPPHGRWQHFEVGGRPRITQLLQSWPSAIDSQERTRRLVDLFLVSVLLDAGAGTKWSYKSKESGKLYSRSEGLAVASLEMFKTGAFSSDPLQPHQVDSYGLRTMTVETLAKGMQVSILNPMEGLEGRAGVLIRLASALENTEIFGKDGRPGNMIDYLISHPTTQAFSVPVVPLPTLWSVLTDGLSAIWPATRTSIKGVPLGDAWPCTTMPSSPPAQPWENIVPFHKLTQWLCYSIMVPMTKLMNMHFAGAHLMTGLPEYRNGGLLVDTGLLTLKEKDRQRGLEIFHQQVGDGKAVEVVPMFKPNDDVVVEWRAVTVGFLDELLPAVNKGLGLEGANALTLAQVLEAGTWKGGREIAQVSRPITKGPPIGIISDGTIF